MSLSCRSAGLTIANCIAREMKLHGGRSSTSTRFQSRSGSGSRRGRMANSRQQGNAPRSRRAKHHTERLKIEPALSAGPEQRSAVGNEFVVGSISVSRCMTNVRTAENRRPGASIGCVAPPCVRHGGLQRNSLACISTEADSPNI